MDDEPMWAADHVVALTSGSAITIPETANKFAIKGNHLTLVKGNQIDGRTKTDHHKHIHEFLGIYDMFKHRDTKNEAVRLMMFPLSLTGEAKTWLDELNEGTIETEITQEVLNTAAGGIFLYNTPNQAYQLLEDKVLLKLDWAKNQKTKSSLKKTVAFADEGSSNSNINKITARMDAMTLKMDAQYKELQSNAKKIKPDLNEDDIPMSREEEAKFMQTFLFDDQYLNPPPCVDHQVLAVIPPEPATLTEADHDIEVAHMDNNPYVDFPIPEPSYEESSSQIEAMQEEINEFERLEVWEPVPHSDRVMIITLKWIYKVKLDELGGVLKNKARLVARGYRQEEGIDFEESFALLLDLRPSLSLLYRCLIGHSRLTK
ncbi:reverse transcriptase domain-containing protein [Tanacetum coccineum]